MRTSYLIYISLAVFTFLPSLQAQENETTPSNTTNYKVEGFGSVATGDKTPFWMVSNRYGKVPLESGNGYLEAGVFHNQQLGKGFHWDAGLDLIVAGPRYKNVYVQQVYAEVGYKALLLTIGSKEKYSSLWNRNLSSGDLVLSTNARPIPEINLSIPEYSLVPYTKGWLQLRGDFAVGRSFDTKYLEKFITATHYTKNVLWHHKSLHFKIEDTLNHFPFSIELGFQHWAQWGGTSTKEDIGKQPQSLKDFVRIVMGKEGGDGATESDQINVLGNHYGSYDFRLNYQRDGWKISSYHQRYFDDKSGMEFQNRLDGLWGLELNIPNTSWIKKLVFEYIDTRDQSGPFHFIMFDHDAHPGRGGGNDNYYNNGEYSTGVSYFNRGLGTALIPAPEYNTDGRPGFQNNRIRDWHIAAEGEISSQIGYRLLFTVMNSWGLHAKPFLEKKSGTSSLISIDYRHPHLSGWLFTGTIAADTGNMLDKGIGFSLGVRKTGILKAW
ncbi:MAG: capsule assembly Wzi family protein [Tannerellaceae bacterium]|nr:capsule assembly Wzi family protein [Tannerellaceae bacterium]